MSKTTDELKARMRAIKAKDSRTASMSPDRVFATLKEGTSVFVVFKDNAQRIKYQRRLVQEAVKFLGKEPRGGIPKGSFAGERVFTWDGDVELALATDVPGDPKGKLAHAREPSNTLVTKISIPYSWS